MDCILKKTCIKHQRIVIILNLCFVKTKTMTEIMDALRRQNDDKPNPATIQQMLNDLVESGHLVKEQLPKSGKRGRDPQGYRRKRGL